MFEIVDRLSIKKQKEILWEIKDVLKQSPLATFVMPRRGIARKTNCTGICTQCFKGDTRDARFHVASTSTGPWGWVSSQCGYHYVQEHPLTGKPFPPIPDILKEIAVETAEANGFKIDPQSGYINVYRGDGRLGLHRDQDEKAMHAPVISISIGCDAFFLKGGIRRSDPVKEMILLSGEVMLMGGEHRLAWHGVKSIRPDTLTDSLKKELRADTRINITIRQYE
jgi:DNA oxidative demethylase